MIQNRIAALVFRVGGFLFALVGLLTHIDIFSGNLNVGLFMYYTIQSNILALIMFGILAIRTIKGLREDGKWGTTSYFARFEMICVIDLLLTLIVYWVLLAPQTFSMAGDFTLFTFDNLSVHLITPALCLIDYILFTKSSHLKYRDVYYVLIYPLSYVGFTIVAAKLGYVFNISPVDGNPVRYPYFFFDFDRVGAKAFLYIGGLVIFFLILSHLLYFLDKKIKKPVFNKRK